MGTKVESQNKQIKAWLESGKSITPLDALNLFGSFRLGARIFDLKNDYGMNIKTEMVEENGKRFARYSLEKEEEQDIDKEIRILFNALLDYLNIQENRVLKEGLSIGTITNDVFDEPYLKELNIKLRYIDEEELKAYRDEKGTTKEG